MVDDKLALLQSIISVKLQLFVFYRLEIIFVRRLPEH
jgi:hypothetical protein